MQNEPSKSMVQFLTKMNYEIYKRITAGQFDASAEETQIKKYLELADHIGSPETSANINLTLYFLQVSIGQVEESITTMATLAAALEAMDDERLQLRAISMRINEAESYYWQGDFDTALHILERASINLDRLKHIPDSSRESVTLSADTGRVLLALERYEDAEAHFKTIASSEERFSEFYLNATIDSMIGYTELHLLKNNTEAAQASANLVREVATRKNEVRRIFLACCAQAHVATATHRNAEPFYDEARAAMDLGAKSGYNLTAILEEMRYHVRHHDLAQAKRFAHLALDAFHNINIHVFDAELSQLSLN